jgi:hypothetical protein
MHLVPSHVAPLLFTVSQTFPHPPQFVIVLTAVSQPFVSGAVLVQSSHPVLQLVYEHLVPSHVAPLLLTVSHARPHALQFVMEFVCVSQPAVFGAAVVQSPKPDTQPV